MATSTEWAKANPERWKEHQIRYRKKKRKPCRACGKEIPFPKMGGKYCSIECRTNVRRINEKQRRVKLRNDLNEFKCREGCFRCGYSQHGAALDFHHPDMNKERRITVGSWKTKKGMEEISKCIILCANCHRVVHHHEKENDKIEQNGDVF